MHFESRRLAGQQLGDELARYSNVLNAQIVALSQDSVGVAIGVAERLRFPISLLLNAPIELPGMSHEVIGLLDQRGDFVYSRNMQRGEIVAYEAEFRGFIEEQKIQKSHRMNQLIGKQGIVNEESLRDNVVIAIHDAMQDPTPVTALVSFLKPIRVAKLVTAAPMAAVSAIDAMHIEADDLEVLQPMAHIEEVNRYYDDPSVYTDDEVLQVIQAVNSQLTSS